MATRAGNRHQRANCNCHRLHPPDVRDDDKLAEHNAFGELGGYWETHDIITDKFDKDMMERLNSELDNLLIFVSGSRGCCCSPYSAERRPTTGRSLLCHGVNVHRNGHGRLESRYRLPNE